MFRRTLTSIIVPFGLAWLALLAFARFGDAPRPWPIEILDTFALYAFVPFLVVGLAALALRSGLLLSVFAAAGLLFAQQYGGYFAPGAALAAAETPTIRILTYNALWKNRDASPLVALIRSEQPDIVVLQELTTTYAEDLRRQLGAAYPHVALADVESRGDGAGVFSRLPIQHRRTFTLSRGGHTLQELRLAVGSGAVTVFNVHLESPELETTNPPGPIPRLVEGYHSSQGDRELERLIAETEKAGGPFILAGDFNIAAESRPYREFPEEWRDTFKERGLGFGHTFPTRYPIWRGRLAVTVPLVRIDYILTSPDLEAARAWVPELAGSDHLPVIADLRLPPDR